MRSFTAQYGFSVCPECGHRVAIGEEAYYNTAGEVQHVTCPSHPEDLPDISKVSVCPKCYLTRPCEHDE